MIHPLTLLVEERHLQTLGIQNAFSRLSIEREALVTTPFQQSANRIRELARGEARHGSCGLGVGETMSDWLSYGNEVIFAGDLEDHTLLIKKLTRMRDIKFSQIQPVLKDTVRNEAINRELRCFHDPEFIEATADIYHCFSQKVNIVGPEYLGRLLNQAGTTIFEGAQGVLLDEWYGFFPYNSWSTLTFKNADHLLEEIGFAGEVVKLGLIRGYATRHGAGPFVTEDQEISKQFPDYHNENNPWQRKFRGGYLDFVALRYALAVIGKVDGLVVTNLDRMDDFPVWKTCSQYKFLSDLADWEKYFTLNSDRIQDIRVPVDPTDLVYQEELTNRLFVTKPVYEDHEKDKNTYLATITERLGVPIVLTSSGPTAQDKMLYKRRIFNGEGGIKLPNQQIPQFTTNYS